MGAEVRVAASTAVAGRVVERRALETVEVGRSEAARSGATAEDTEAAAWAGVTKAEVREEGRVAVAMVVVATAVEVVAMATEVAATEVGMGGTMVAALVVAESAVEEAAAGVVVAATGEPRVAAFLAGAGRAAKRERALLGAESSGLARAAEARQEVAEAAMEEVVMVEEVPMVMAVGGGVKAAAVTAVASAGVAATDVAVATAIRVVGGASVELVKGELQAAVTKARAKARADSPHRRSHTSGTACRTCPDGRGKPAWHLR